MDVFAGLFLKAFTRENSFGGNGKCFSCSAGPRSNDHSTALGKMC